MSNLLIALVLFSTPPKPDASPPKNVDDLCFAESLCAFKEAIRWKTPKWEHSMCYRIANAIIREEHTYGIPRDFQLAIMINESDMNEKAMKEVVKDGRVVARDGGLMGIRCKIGLDGRCSNLGSLRPADVMRPEINIHLASRKLASLRDRSRCLHRDHPWFAHYNWGDKVFTTGTPKRYPLRVAVLWKAIADKLALRRPEIDSLRFSKDNGKLAMLDSPIGIRSKELVRKIRFQALYSCSGDALVNAPEESAYALK